MIRRSLVAAIWLGLAGLLGLAGPEPVHALDLQVVSQAVEADFPTVLRLDVSFEAEEPVAEAYVLYALAHEEVSTESAAELAGDGSSASAAIDMETAFVPAGVDVTYRWRLVADDESEIVTPATTVTWRDDRFDWERSASEDVEVFAYAGGESLRNEVLASAQETVDRLTVEFAVDVEHPVRIWVYASKDDFDGTLASNSQEWAAGAAYPELQLILAVIPEGRPSELGRIIPHEVSHQILAMAADNPYNAPATWLDEGIAVMNQTNGTSHMARLVATAKRDGRLLPLAALNGAFPYAPEEASLAYAQSFSVVTYLVETYGEDALTSIARAYSEGNTHDAAIRAGTGRDIDQLDAEWRRSIDDGVAATIDREAVANALIYGVPGIGVIAYLVARRLKHSSAYPDEPEAAA